MLKHSLFYAKIAQTVRNKIYFRLLRCSLILCKVTINTTFGKINANEFSKSMLLQQYPIEQNISCKHSTKKVSNCKFWHCRKIGRYFARVPTKSSNLFLARKIARILHLRISLIISDLHTYMYISLIITPLQRPKTVFFRWQKHRF